MALDRQRILSELGSVMNQLKSADCGCMNNIFGDRGQNAAPMENPYQSYGGCRRGGCCGHSCGWNQGSSGEPFQNTPQNSYPCMGMRCNPPKLYADTYGYLNQSLMQPTVKEVYEDLKSINPTNTVMNNPMGNQMGLSNEMTGQGGMQAPNQFQGTVNNRGDMSNNPSPGNNANQMGGMGPQIMNMLGGNILKQSNVTPQSGQLLEPMVIDAPQSPHGKVGVTPLSAPMSNPSSTAGQYHFSNPSNSRANVNSQNPMTGTQQFANLNPTQHSHGQQHGMQSQGIAKFNEMFPGVMKSDLGFDPMAIAIQMNPANQKQAAIDTMYKMLNNNTGINRMYDNKNSSQVGNMQANNQITSEPRTVQSTEPARDAYQAPTPGTQEANIDISGQLQGQNISPNQQLPNPNIVNQTSFGQANSNKVYTAITNPPNSNQQQYLQQQYQQQQYQQQQYQQQQSIIDPNSGYSMAPPTLPSGYEGTAQTGLELQPTNQTVDVSNRQQMIREPIFPADTSRYVPIRQKYDYNTLGQPVNRQSAKMYHTPEPTLPQTLSPQPVMKQRNDSKYSNVKSTISKTSIIGGNRRIDKAASRSQLQQIYNTYKGSHSYTQQNINDQAKHGATNSDGKLQAVPQTNHNLQQIPIEKIGGDTAANVQQDQRTHKVEEVIGQIGDVPVANKLAQPTYQKESNPIGSRKGRNGLQDMVYTSYPTSAAWSFHGHNRALPGEYQYRY